MISDKRGCAALWYVRKLLSEDSFNIQEEQVHFYINEGNKKKKNLETESGMWISAVEQKQNAWNIMENERK